MNTSIPAVRAHLRLYGSLWNRLRCSRLSIHCKQMKELEVNVTEQCQTAEWTSQLLPYSGGLQGVYGDRYRTTLEQFKGSWTSAETSNSLHSSFSTLKEWYRKPLPPDLELNKVKTTPPQRIAETALQKLSHEPHPQPFSYSTGCHRLANQTAAHEKMGSTIKTSVGAKEQLILLSDDEDYIVVSSSRAAREDHTDSSEVDVIDLTGPLKIPKRKQRIHSRHDGSITAATSASLPSSQARMIPTVETFSSYKHLRLSEGDDDELALRRELSDHEARAFQRARALRHALPRGYNLLESTKGRNGLQIKPEMGVQLSEKVSGEIPYFWIRHIIKDAKGEIWLRGISLKRNYEIYTHISKETGQPLHAILPLGKNELCMHLQGAPDTLGSPLNDDCLSIIHLSEVEQEREIIFTNHEWPVFNYIGRGMSAKLSRPGYVEEHGVLCCRWKYVEEVYGKYGVPAQVVALEEAECDKGKRKPDVERRRTYGKQAQSTWQASLVDLTKDKPMLGKRSRVEVEEDELNLSGYNFTNKRLTKNTVHERLTPIPGSSLPRPKRYVTAAAPMRAKAYTFGDICAGAGGTFRGAEMAGLDTSWALDRWDVAINTLRRNWPQKRDRFLKISIQDFVLEVHLDQDCRVDVIHISYPCQGHSRANTGVNPELDLENNATITTLSAILKRLRPRIVTLEQTDGILTKNEGFWFRKVISLLTGEGYSARSKVFNMAEYGLCQARHRLMVVAACPGQKLPNWPKPTHGDGPGLKPFVTLGEAIQNIPPHVTAHDIEDHKRRFKRSHGVADTSLPLKACIKTKGVECLLVDENGLPYWPTYRQQLRMQGFPDHHELTGLTQEDFTTQIGNAVPVIFATTVFREVIKTLKESDKEADEWEWEVINID